MQKEGLREYNRSYLTKKLVKIKRGEKKDANHSQPQEQTQKTTYNNATQQAADTRQTKSVSLLDTTTYVLQTDDKHPHSHNQKSPCMLFAGTRNRKQKQKYGNKGKAIQRD